jgi:hypothetical protein
MPCITIASHPNKGDLKMRKIILTLIGSALFAASTVQIAAAAQHHRVPKADREALSEQSRNANAYAWPAPWEQPGWSRYQGGAISAPAGVN